MGTLSKDKHGEDVSLPGSGLPQIVFPVPTAMSFRLLSSLLTEIERTDVDRFAVAADHVTWDVVQSVTKPRKVKVSGRSDDCIGGMVFARKDNCEGDIGASAGVGERATFELNFHAAEGQKMALCCTKDGDTSEMSTYVVP